MTYTIELMPLARQQLQRALGWWTSSRQAAPELLRDELDRVFSNLVVFPELGRSLSNGRRRLTLVESEMHVTYRVRPKLKRIEVVRIMPARRAR